MPEIALSPGAVMFYQDDDFTDPWSRSEAALLLHGNAESSVSWNGWMPHLGRRFRVVRPDMRGYGRSTPMPLDYPWSLDGIIDDFVQLMDRLEIERFHLVGAKTAGGIAVRFAASKPERIRSLTISGARINRKESSGSRPETRALIERGGVESYARATMAGRLGSDSSPEMLEGWIKLMGATPTSTMLGFLSRMSGVDVTDELGRIVCPTLVLAPETWAGGNAVAETRVWQQRIPDSELVAVEGDSYHIAATHADDCARAMLDFIDRHVVGA
jgi:3-oxoadipate enol-lactonase